MEPLINAILYVVFLFGALFLILGTALVLLIVAALPVIWKKNLSFLMISLGINILVIPLSFIGGMATDSLVVRCTIFGKYFCLFRYFRFPSTAIFSLVACASKKKKFMCSVFNANKLSVWAAYYIITKRDYFQNECNTTIQLN